MVLSVSRRNKYVNCRQCGYWLWTGYIDDFGGMSRYTELGNNSQNTRLGHLSHTFIKGINSPKQWNWALSSSEGWVRMYTYMVPLISITTLWNKLNYQLSQTAAKDYMFSKWDLFLLFKIKILIPLCYQFNRYLLSQRHIFLIICIWHQWFKKKS